MGLFIWTWTEEIIDWCHQDSPCPQKCRQWRGSDKSHDQHSLQIWEHPLCVCWLSWHYSKYSLLQKILRISFVSSTGLYMTTLPVVRICCVPWQCSVTWPIEWFVQKMELGSLGTSTIVTGYIPMWLWFLSGSERTITLHLPQDDRWWCECKEHALSDISRTDPCRGCQMPSTHVAMFLQCCKMLYLQFVKRKL